MQPQVQPQMAEGGLHEIRACTCALVGYFFWKTNRGSIFLFEVKASTEAINHRLQTPEGQIENLEGGMGSFGLAELLERRLAAAPALSNHYCPLR